MDEGIRIPVVVDGGKSFIFFDELEQQADQAATSISQLAEPINRIERELNDLERSARRTGAGLAGIENATRGPGSSLDNLGRSATRAKTGVEGLKDPLRATANAGFAFNQILREAPAFAFDFRTGLIGISNNLPIFTDALKNATAAGATKTQVLKSLAANLLSLPSILSIGILALTAFGDQLFNVGKGFSDAEVEAERFKLQLGEVKSSIDNLFTSSDFENKINKLKAELQFGKGFKTDIIGFQFDKEANDRNIALANQEIDKSVEFIGGIRKDAAFTLGQSARQLLEAYYSREDQIPDDAIKKLSDREERILNNVKEYGIRQVAFEQQRAKLVNANQEQALQQQIRINEENKRQQEKALDDLKDYISKAKALAKELEDAFVVPKFSVFDSQADQLNKAKQLFSDFNAGTLKIKFSIAPIFSEPEEFKAVARSFTEMFAKEIEAAGVGQSPNLVDSIFGDNAKLLEQFDKKFKALGASIKIDPSTFFGNAPAENLKELNKQLATAVERYEALKNVAAGVGDAVGDIFRGVADGENIFKAVGEAVKDLVIDIVSAAVKAFILKKILGGFLGGGAGAAAGGGLLSGLGIPGFASGGIISGPMIGFMGEGPGTSRMNPEVISPLDQLQSFFGGMIRDVVSGVSGGSSMNSIGGASIQVPDQVRIVMDGDELVGALEFVKRRQNRNG